MKNNIRPLREEMSMSQEELANRVDVSRQTIISIEKGKFNPSLELAFKLAGVFKLKLEDIFQPEGD